RDQQDQKGWNNICPNLFIHICFILEVKGLISMLDKRLFKISRARQALGGLCILTFVQALAIIGHGRAISIALTRLWQQHPLKSVFWVVLIFIGSYVLRQLMGVFKEYALEPFAGKTTGMLQSKLTQKYAKLGPSTISDLGTGKS